MPRPVLSRRAWLATLAAIPLAPALADDRRDDERPRPTLDRGALVRGPRDRKRLALVFTGDRFAEGAATILDALRRREARSAWFVTGRFLREPDFAPLLRRACDEGHDLGPHSDQHLLYASWDRPPKLLVSRKEFLADLQANDRALSAFVPDPAARFPYFLPPYEHHTAEIARWTTDADRILVNLTPGTRSHTDYMEDDDPAFVPSRDIAASVLKAERSDPDGLSGYLLLMHLGAGPRRTRDHLHEHIGPLLDGIKDRGYEFVGLAELLRKSTLRTDGH